MTEKTFQILFGSKFRIYLLRYLFFNQGPYLIKEIEKFFQIEKNKTKKQELRKEIKNLIKIGLLKQNKNKLYLIENFFLLEELKKIASNFSPEVFKEIKKELSPLRSIVLLALGGIFTEETIIVNDKERLDLLIVLRKKDKNIEKKIEKKIDKVSKIIGTELNYTILTKKEFEYQRSMFNKFLENWFAQNPKIIIEKIRI